MPTHRVVKIDELSQYFHLPEKAVAKQLGVCLTSLKKICRQNGITRWPYRKLKSLDKKINKIENALTNTAEDPSAMLVKWEMLKLEKKNLPFAGSDDSDLESRRRSSPVAHTVASQASTSPSSCTSSPTEQVVMQDWSNAPSPPASVASGASTPNPGGMPPRALHTLLEQKLRQVGTVTAHRELLARSQGQSSPSDPPSQQNRPADLDILEEEDDVMALAPTSEEDDERPNLQDFYGRLDSARLSARSAVQEETFRCPDSFSFGDIFPLEEPEPIHKLTDSLFSDEFLMLPTSS
jgi:hypothetical protein